MRETGDRYNLRCTGSQINIVDLLNSKTTIVSDKGVVVSDAIPRENVISWIDTIMEILLSPGTKQTKSLLGNMKTLQVVNGRKDELVITQQGHMSWSIYTYSGCALLTANKLYKKSWFDQNLVLRKLNYVKSILISAGKKLKPEHDIARRISDVGAVVLTYGGNSIICYESEISGSAVCNCLVNGLYHTLIYISVNTDTNEVNVFDKELHLLFSCPVDDSLLHFFSDDTEDL